MSRDVTVMIPVVAGIGNALMAQPMVGQIKRGWPECKVVVVARIGAMGEPFGRMGEVDEVRIMGKGSLGMARSVMPRRGERADVFVVPFPSNRWQYTMLAFASGARRRIMHSYAVGKIRSLGFLPAERMAAVRGIHDVQQNLYLLRKLGIEPDVNEGPRFEVRGEDRAGADRILKGADVKGDGFVVIHAGSAATVLAKAKRWPTGSYAELIGALKREVDAPIVVVEGPDEEGVAEEIASRATVRVHVVKLRGPLGEAAGLLERARLYVGTDSGLAHLAAAVGTSPVTLFGPADPDRVCPYGYRHLVVRPNCTCCPSHLYPWESPYPRLRNPNARCIETIRTEDVMQAVRRAMQVTASR